jgi:hypothetical protein
MNNQIQEIQIKTKQSKRLDENGNYDNRPIDPDYFKKYWQENNWKETCKRCGVQVARLRMCKHIKSKKCMEAAKTMMCYQTAILILEQKNRELDKQILELKS